MRVFRFVRRDLNFARDAAGGNEDEDVNDVSINIRILLYQYPELYTSIDVYLCLTFFKIIINKNRNFFR